MQTNQRWMKSLALTASVLGMAGAANAQTATLTSVVWTSITGTTTFAGPPSFTTALSGTPSGAFGAGTLALGATTSISFPTGFLLTTANVAGGPAIGANTGNFDLTINAATVSVAIPITYSVTNSILGLSSPTVTNFTVAGRDFRMSMNTLTSAPATGTAQTVFAGASIQFLGFSTAPEPGTLALLGLGIAPIAVAIRRRRK